MHGGPGRPEMAAYQKGFYAVQQNFAARKAYNDRRTHMNRYQAIEVLGGVCMDCGYKANLDALEFDHRPGTIKTCTIAKLLMSPWVKIEAELKKCDLVCANCHAIRTQKRLHACS